MLCSPASSLDSSYAADVLPGLIVIGFAMGSIMPASMQTATLGVDRQYAGAASAMVNTSQQVGGSIGTALLNTLAATAATELRRRRTRRSRRRSLAAGAPCTATRPRTGGARGSSPFGAVLSAVVFRRKGDGLSVATARPRTERPATVAEPQIPVGT